MAGTVAKMMLSFFADTHQAKAGIQQLNSQFDQMKSAAGRMVHDLNEMQRAVNGQAGASSSAANSMKSLNSALDQAAGSANRAGSGIEMSAGAMSRAVAAGQLMANTIMGLTQKLTGIIGGAAQSVAAFEKMSATMASMAAKELVDMGKFKSFDDALGAAGEKAKDLLDWTQKLALQSPFESADVSQALSMAQAFGFVATQYKTTAEAQKAGVISAQRLTEATMNWAAATGKAGHDISRVVTIAGQIQSLGKLMGGDSMQLKQMGINLEGLIGKALGKTTEQVIEMREKGLIPASMALGALIGDMETFGNAAALQGNSLGGMMASLADLQDLATRKIFTGIFDALKPALSAAISALQDPAVLQAMENFGNAMGDGVSVALSFLMSFGQTLTQVMAGLAGPIQVGVAAFSMLFGIITQGAASGQEMSAFWNLMQAGAGNIGTAIAVAIQAFNALWAVIQSGEAGWDMMSQAVMDVETLFGGPVAAAFTGLVSLIDSVVSEALYLGSTFGTLSGAMLGLFQGDPLASVVVGLAEARDMASALYLAGSPIGSMFLSLAQAAGQVKAALGQIAGGGLAALGAVLQGLADNFGFFADAAYTALGAVAGLVGIVAAGIGGVLGQALLGIAALAPVVFGGLAQTAQSAAGIIQSLASVVGPVLMAAFQGLQGAVGAVFTYLPSLVDNALVTFNTLVGIVGGILVGAFQALAPAATTVFNALPGLATTFMQVLGAVAGFIQTVLVGAFNAVAPIATAVFQGLGAILQAVLPPLINLINVIGNGLAGAFNAAQPVVQSLFSQLAALAQQAAPHIVGIATAIGQWLAGAITAVTPLVQSFFQQLPGWITAAGPAITTLAGFVGGVLVGAFNIIKPIAAAVFQALPGLIQSAIPVIQTLAGMVGGFLVQAFQAIGSVITWVSQNWGAMAAAGQLIGTVVVNIGAAVGGFLVGALQTLGGVVAWVTANWQAIVSVLSAVAAGFAAFTIITTVIAWITAAIGVVTGIAGAVMAVVGPVMGFVSAVGGLGAAISWLIGIIGAFLGVLFSPVVIIAVVIGAIVGLAVAWATNMGGIRDKTAEAWAGVQAAFQSAVGAVGSAVGQIVTSVQTTWNGLTTSLTTAASNSWNAVTAVFSGIGPALGAAVTGALTSVQTAFSAAGTTLATSATTATAPIATAFQTGLNALQTIATNIWTAVTTAFQTGVNAVMAVVSPIASAFQSAFGAAFAVIAPLVQAAMNVLNAFAGLVTAVAGVIGAVLGLLGTAVQGIFQNVIVPTLAAAAAFISGVFQSTVQAAMAAVAAAFAPVVAAWTAGMNTLQAALAVLSAYIGAAWDYISAYINFKIAEISAYINAGIAIIQAIWQMGMTALQTAAATAWAAIQAGFTAASAFITSIINGIVSGAFAAWKAGIVTLQAGWNAFWTFLQSVGNWIGNAFAGLIRGLISGAMSAWQSAVTALQGVWNNFYGAIQTIAGYIGGTVKTTLQGLADLINGAVAGAVNWIVQRVKDLTSAFQGVADAIDGVIGWLDDLADAISNISLPDWMTPGSPMPLEIAMWGLGKALDNATGAMGGFNSVTGDASIPSWLTPGSPTPLETGLYGIASAFRSVAAAGNVQTSVAVAFSINGYDQIADAADSIAQVGKEIVNKFGKAGKKISESTLEGAKKLQEGIDAASAGIRNVLQLIPDLLKIDPAAVMFNYDQLADAANAVAQIGKEIANKFGKAGKKVSESTLEGAKVLSEALSAASTGINATLTLIPSLLDFGASAGAAVLATREGYDALVDLAAGLSSFALAVAARWGAVGATLDASVGPAAKALAESIQHAAAGITAAAETANLLNRLRAENFQLPDQTAASTFVTRLGSWAAAMTNAFNESGAILNQNIVPAGKNLAEAIQTALQGVSDGLALASAVGAAMLSGIPLPDLSQAKNFASSLASWAAQVTNEFNTGAVALNVLLTPAGTRLAEAVTTALSAVSDSLALATATGNAIASGFRLPDMATVQQFLLSLSGWTARVVNSFNQGATALNNGLTPSGKYLAEAITTTLRAVSDAISLAVTTGNAITGGFTLPDMATIQQFVQALAGWTARVINSFNRGATALNLGLVPAGQQLGQAITTSLSAVNEALALATATGGAIASGYQLPDMATVQGFVQALSGWTARVINSLNQGATALNTALTPAGVAFAAAVKTALEGIQSALNLASTMAGAVSDGLTPPDYNATIGFIARFGTWAVFVANQFNTLAGDLDTKLAPAGVAAAAAIKNTLDGVAAAIGLAATANEAIGANAQPPNYNATIGFIARFATWAIFMANQFNDMAGALDADLAPAGVTAANSIKNALEGVRAALSLAAAVNEGIAANVTPPNYNATVGFIARLGTWAVFLANAFNDIAGNLDADLAPAGVAAAASIKTALDGVQQALSLVNVMAAATATPPAMPNQATAQALVSNLTAWAVAMANAFSTAGVALNTKLAPAGVAAAAAIKNTLDGIQSALNILKVLTEYAALQPPVPDAGLGLYAYELAQWATIVANQWNVGSDTLVVKLNPAGAALAAAAKVVLEGITTAISLLKVLTDYAATKPPVPDAGLGLYAYELAQWATTVANQWNVGADTLQTKLTAAGAALAAATKQTLDGIQSAMTLLKVLGEYAATKPPVPDAGLGLYAYELAQWAVIVSNQWNVGADTLQTKLSAAGAALTAATKQALDGIQSAITLLKTLSEFAANKPGLPDPGLATYAGQLAAWAVGVSNAFNNAATTFETKPAAAGAALAASIKVALDGLEAAVGALRLLTALQDPKNAVSFNDGMTTLAQSLGTWAAKLANAFNTGASEFNDKLAPAGEAAANGIKAALGGIEAAVGAVRLLAGLQDPKNVIAFNEGMAVMAQNLGVWAARLANAFNSGAQTFDAALAPAAEKAAAAIKVSLDGIGSTIALIRLLAGTQDPKNLVTFDQSMIQMATNFGQWGNQLATAFNSAAGTFDATLSPAAEKMAASIKSAADGISATIQLLGTLTGYAKAPVENVAGLIVLAGTLSGYGRDLATAFAMAAVGFEAVTNLGVPALESTLKSAAEAITQVISLIDALAGFRARPVDMTGLFELADKLGQDAQTIAAAFARTAAGFDAITNQGVGALSEGIGKAADALLKVMDLLPRLLSFLPSYVGFPAHLSGALDRLLDTIKTIFVAFANKAQSAGISEAATKAAGLLSEGFGKAIDSINGAMDLMERFLNPESRPHIGDVSDLLDPIFDFIMAVTAEFAARAASMDATQIDAAQLLGDAVGSVFDAINQVADAVQNWTGVNFGGSGFNNIAAMLHNVFELFSKYAGQAGTAQAVASAIGSIAAALQTLNAATASSGGGNATNLGQMLEGLSTALPAQMGQLGTNAGSALMNNLAASIRGGQSGVIAAISEVIAAIGGRLATGLVVGGAGGLGATGAGGATVPTSTGDHIEEQNITNNYYTLVQYVDPVTGGASRNSFQGMSTLQP